MFHRTRNGRIDETGVAMERRHGGSSTTTTAPGPAIVGSGWRIGLGDEPSTFPALAWLALKLLAARLGYAFGGTRQ